MPDKTPQSKPTIGQWVADFRTKVSGVPSDMSDAEVFRQIAEVDPDVLQDVQTTQQAPPQPPQGSKFDRFMGGVGSSMKEWGQGVAAHPIKSALSMAVPPLAMAAGGIKDLQQDTKDIVGGRPQDVSARKAEQLQSMVDLPNIGEDIRKGDWSHAAGRATVQGLKIASMVAPFGKTSGATSAPKVAELDEMLALGKSSLKESGALNAAKMLTREHTAILNKDLAGVEQTMNNQLINAVNLRKSILQPLKSLKTPPKPPTPGVAYAERVPEAPVRGIQAAKDALDRAELYAKRGMVPWRDAHKLYEELNSVEGDLGKGASQLRDGLRAVRKGLGEELKSSATRAGVGTEYAQWLENYHKLSSLQRAYVRITRGESGAGLEAKATASPERTVPMTRGTVRVGSRQSPKVARAEIKAWHKSVQELHRQISKPTGGTPPGGAGVAQGAVGAGAVAAQGMPSVPTTPPNQQQ